MITFGFKNRFGGWLRAIAAIVVGLIMVIKPETSLMLVVKVLAAFLIASGLVSFAYGIINRQRGALSLMVANAVVDVVLGVIIFMYPGAVASVIIFLLGVVLLVLGVFQIVVLASTTSVIGFGFMFFIFPVLCAIGGSLLLSNPFGSASALTLVAGIATLVYGISEFLATCRMNKAMKAYDVKFSGPETNNTGKVGNLSDVKDVEYEKVED